MLGTCNERAAAILDEVVAQVSKYQITSGSELRATLMPDHRVAKQHVRDARLQRRLVNQGAVTDSRRAAKVAQLQELRHDRLACHPYRRTATTQQARQHVHDVIENDGASSGARHVIGRTSIQDAERPADAVAGQELVIFLRHHGVAEKALNQSRCSRPVAQELVSGLQVARELLWFKGNLAQRKACFRLAATLCGFLDSHTAVNVVRYVAGLVERRHGDCSIRRRTGGDNFGTRTDYSLLTLDSHQRFTELSRHGETASAASVHALLGLRIEILVERCQALVIRVTTDSVQEFAKVLEFLFGFCTSRDSVRALGSSNGRQRMRTGSFQLFELHFPINAGVKLRDLGHQGIIARGLFGAQFTVGGFCGGNKRTHALNFGCALFTHRE